MIARGRRRGRRHRRSKPITKRFPATLSTAGRGRLEDSRTISACLPEIVGAASLKETAGRIKRRMYKSAVSRGVRVANCIAEAKGATTGRAHCILVILVILVIIVIIVIQGNRRRCCEAGQREFSCRQPRRSGGKKKRRLSSSLASNPASHRPRPLTSQPNSTELPETDTSARTSTSTTSGQEALQDMIVPHLKILIECMLCAHIFKYLRGSLFLQAATNTVMNGLYFPLL